jgi:3-hydroxyisobutyrate dehydrogenase-like beta-hydroxyacid dehydrogenase
MAIWVGGDKAAFEKHKAVLDAMGDRAAYIGPIGTATVAKLVHNMSGYAITCALAETFTMGVKAGMDPVALWEAVRQGVGGRRFTFDGLLDQFLPGNMPVRLSERGALNRRCAAMSCSRFCLVSI